MRLVRTPVHSVREAPPSSPCLPRVELPLADVADSAYILAGETVTVIHDVRAPRTPHTPPPPSGTLMGLIPSAPPKDFPHTPPLSPRASDAQRAATALGSVDRINPICSPKIRAPPTPNAPPPPSGASMGSIPSAPPKDLPHTPPLSPRASDAQRAATALGSTDGINPICSPKIRAPPTPNAPPPPSGALMGSIPSAPPKDLPHTPPLSPRASDAQRAATALGSTDGINPICSPKIRAPPTLNTPHAPDTCPLTQPRSARRIDEPRIRIRGGGSESEGYVRGGSISPDFAHGHGHGHAPMTAAELLRPQSSRPPLGGTTHSSDDHTPPASGARTNTHIDAADVLPPAGGHLSTAEAAHYAHA
ncbi:hypothetical protein DFH09DRAFT_1341329 [Mycena vulgaris]|nr:hypothetical protein DFH09DRAFT_1341329 [Mycena vulgaris]